MQILLNSSDLSEFKKYSIVYNPVEDKRKSDDGQDDKDKVQYVRPCYVKSFKDNVVRVEVASRHQTIIQTVYEVFVYRSDGINLSSFGQGRMELNQVCALRYAYCLDHLGFIRVLAVAVDKENLREDTVEFSGAEELLYNRNIRIFNARGQNKSLKKAFDIHCNQSNGLDGLVNWPPSDLKFDDQAKRIVVVSKHATLLCVFCTVKIDWQLQSEPIVRFHRSMMPVKMSMPLQIINVPHGKGRQLTAKEDLCLAILCGMGGTIHVFRLPSGIEIWNKIRTME